MRYSPSALHKSHPWNVHDWGMITGFYTVIIHELRTALLHVDHNL